jgi:histidinol-phosphatase
VPEAGCQVRGDATVQPGANGSLASPRDFPHYEPRKMPSRELQAALEAAQMAADVIRGFYGKKPTVRTKPDLSPVTEADIEAEKVIRAVLEQAFPSYGFYGEETGQRAIEAPNLWLVDPIDGTKSFVRETPFFSTQIALMREGELVLGVSSAPVYGELAWAEKGGGAFLNDRPIRVSSIAILGHAFISTGNLKSLTGSPRWERLRALIGRVARIRGYGDFVHYHLLARGALDVVIESDVNILDIAALAVVVREAGGIFTDLDGNHVELETRSVLAANDDLHPVVLEMLKAPQGS